MDFSVANMGTQVCSTWKSGNDFMAEVMRDDPNKLAFGEGTAAVAFLAGRMAKNMPGTKMLIALIALMGLGNQVSVAAHNELCGNGTSEEKAVTKESDLKLKRLNHSGRSGAIK